MRYVPALDGIRALAVLLVVVSHAHAGPAFLRMGSLGVDIFFVLSGFLITRLLMNEMALSGRLDVKRFYLHRFARLTPPLLLMLALYGAIAPFAWPQYEHHLRDMLVASAYLSDYGEAIWAVPSTLRHTWSLAVEEHFYLLWPLALLFLRPCKPKTLLWIMAGAFLLATFWRVYCVETQIWELVYYRFDTRLSGLILGAFVAVLLTFSWRRFFKDREVLLLLLLLLLGLAALGEDMGWKHMPTLQYGVLAIELIAALVIVAAMKQAAFVGWLAWGPLVYIGRLSYGVYLFHYPIMLYLRESYGWEVALWAGLTSALLLSSLSYHTIEARVRHWRAKRSEGAPSRPDAFLQQKVSPA